MSYRNRIAALVLGLICAVSSGQAQEHTQSEQGQIAQQKQPAQALPPPFPVVIIEDEAAANARERREAESRQHEIDDLAAQKGMNTATKAMNEATQNMALYTLISTVFVGIGTVLLFVTLYLTHQANEAAQAAVNVTQRIGDAQLRSYLGITKVWIERDNPRSMFNIKNFGQTPGYDITVRTYTRRNHRSGTVFSKDPHLFTIIDPNQEWVGSMPIGVGLHDDGKVLEEAEIIILLSYQDISKNRIIRRHRFELLFDNRVIGTTVDFGLRGEGTRERFYAKSD